MSEGVVRRVSAGVAVGRRPDRGRGGHPGGLRQGHRQPAPLSLRRGPLPLLPGPDHPQPAARPMAGRPGPSGHGDRGRDPGPARARGRARGALAFGVVGGKLDGERMHAIAGDNLDRIRSGRSRRRKRAEPKAGQQQDRDEACGAMRTIWRRSRSAVSAKPDPAIRLRDAPRPPSCPSGRVRSAPGRIVPGATRPDRSGAAFPCERKYPASPPRA